MNIPYADRLEQAADYLLIWFKVMAPKDTGNLAINAIKKTYDPATGFPMIVIGGELAPYAVYTNEVWINRPGTNPNQGWIGNTIEMALPMIQVIMTGTLTPEEYAKLTGNAQIIFTQQLDAIAERKGV